jgi:uncharacterized SAM-binding protein YcdF (DUF218 family)
VILRRAARGLGLVFGLGVATCAGVFALKAHHEGAGGNWQDAPRPADYVVVLGGSGWLSPCGYWPEIRMVKGVEVAAANPGSRLVYTHFFEGDEVIAKMHATLSAAHGGHDLPADTIFETESRSTFENAWRTVALLDLDPAARVILVTDAVHLARARLLWRRFAGSWPDAAVVPMEWEYLRGKSVARYSLREAASWWLNLGKLAGWEMLGLIGWSPARRAEVIW